MANTLTDPYTNFYLNNLNKSPALGTSGYFNNISKNSNLYKPYSPPLDFGAKDPTWMQKDLKYKNNMGFNSNIYAPEKEKESSVESWMTGNKYFKPETTKNTNNKDWLTKNSKTVKGIGNVGNILGEVSKVIPPVNEDPTTNTINAGYNAVADAAMAIPGYGTLIGGAMKVMDFGNKALSGLTGGATTVQNPSTTADKILSSNLFGLSPIGITNALTKTKVSGTDKDIANIAQSYGGVNTTEDTEIGGVSKAWSWLTGSGNKAKQSKSITNLYNTQNVLKAKAVQDNLKKLKSASNITQDLASKNNQQLFGGQNYRTLSAKKGTKLSFTKIKKQAARKMQEGGKMNLLPTGALHARKHNLPNEIAEDLTKKGIPVISYDEGGEIIQHCEIERDEIIFNIDLTKQLEKLKKDFDNGDENAALVAGQLLTTEILENTIDKSQLIQNIT